MTREEAIKFAEYAQIMADGKPDVQEFYKLAESALRTQQELESKFRVFESNEPLTLDELREMDGEPVWCEIYIKGQSSFYGIVHGENVTGFIPGDDNPSNLAITNVGAYGLAWLAYRQKPEEDDHG